MALMLETERLVEAAPEDVGMSSARLRNVSHLVQRYLDEEKFPGAISLVARRGKVVHFETYGEMDHERHVPMARGHSIYVDSPWALTSISQAQFWNNVSLSQYGDGTIRGIISVDISEWEEPGINGKATRLEDDGRIKRRSNQESEVHNADCGKPQCDLGSAIG